MRPYWVAFGLSACTTAVFPSDEAADKNGALARQSVEELVRVETRAGAFLVRESCAQEFRGVLAGEMTEHSLWAGR